MEDKNIVLIEKLYEEYKKNVYYMAYLYLHDTYEAEECLQKVFCLASMKIQKLQTHPHPKYWLMASTKNICLETLRLRKKIVCIEINSIELEHYLLTENFEEEIIEHLEPSSIDLNKERNYILSKLSQSDRELYLLRYEKRLDIKAIADKLHISYTAVTTRLTRLKNKIIMEVKKLNLG